MQTSSISVGEWKKHFDNLFKHQEEEKRNIQDTNEYEMEEQSIEKVLKELKNSKILGPEKICYEMRKYHNNITAKNYINH